MSNIACQPRLESFANIVKRGQNLSASQKELVIRDLLFNNTNNAAEIFANKLLLAKVINYFDATINVYVKKVGVKEVTDSEGNITYEDELDLVFADVTSVTVQKTIDELEKLSEESDDLFTEGDLQSGAFGEEQKDALNQSTVKVINNILQKIPLIDRIEGGQYIVSDKTFNPNIFKQLIYNLNAQFDDRLNNWEDLANLLFLMKSSDSITNESERQHLESFYEFVFGNGNLNYIFDGGSLYNQQFTIKNKSILTKYKETNNANIKLKLENILNLFYSHVASTNAEIRLSYRDENGMNLPLGTINKEKEVSIRNEIIKNTFDIMSDDEGNAKLTLKSPIVEALDNQNVYFKEEFNLGDIIYGTLNTSIDGLIYNIPFEVNYTKNSNISNINVNKNLNPISNIVAANEFLTNSGYTLNIPKDPIVIKKMLDSMGYEGLLDINIIEDFINSKDRQKGLINLLDTTINAYLQNVLQFKLNDGLNPDGSINTQYWAEQTEMLKPIINSIQAMSLNTSGVSRRNIGRALKEFKTITNLGNLESVEVFSPTFNFVGNRKLADQIVATKGLTKPINDYTVEGKLSPVHNTQSNFGKVSKQVKEIQDIVEKGETTVFGNNIFVKGEAKVVEIRSDAGFKSTDGNTVKDISLLNDREITGQILSYFLSSIKKYTDIASTEVKRFMDFPMVLSDKSKFPGVVYETMFNILPTVPVANDSEGKRVIDVYNLLNIFRKNYLENNLGWQKGIVNNFLNAKGISVDGLTELPLINEEGLNAYNDLIFLNTTASPLEIIQSIITNPKYINQLEVIPVLSRFVTQKNGALSLNDSVFNYLELDLTPQRILEVLKQAAIYGTQVRTEFNLPITEEFEDFYKARNLYFNNNNNYLSIDDINNFSSIEEVVNYLQFNIDPLLVSHYFAHITLTRPFQELQQGSLLQYGKKDLYKTDELGNKVLDTANTYHQSLNDFLKRTVGNIAPYQVHSVDTKMNIPNDYRLPIESDYIEIEDPKISRTLLGSSEETSQDTYDGGALANPIWAILSAKSYGGLLGINPNHSLKYIYKKVDSITGESELIKYASYVINEDWLKLGTENVQMYLKTLLGGKQLGDIYDINFTVSGQRFTQRFTENQTMYDIYNAVNNWQESKKNTVEGFSDKPIFELLTDVILSVKGLNSNKYDLKTKMLSQIIFKGGKKTGNKNTYKYEQFINKTKNNNFTFQLNKHDNRYIGMQLDATHAPENSTISLFSQAYTAAVTEGRTPQQSKELLNNLAKLGDVNEVKINEIFDNGLEIREDFNPFEDEVKEGYVLLSEENIQNPDLIKVVYRNKNGDLLSDGNDLISITKTSEDANASDAVYRALKINESQAKPSTKVIAANIQNGKKVVYMEITEIDETQYQFSPLINIASIQGNEFIAGHYSSTLEPFYIKSPKTLIRKKLFDFKDIKVKDGDTYRGFDNLEDFTEFWSNPDKISKEERIKQILIALARKSNSGRDYNSTQEALINGTVDFNSPLYKKVLESAVNSFLNKTLISFKFAGMQAVLAPSHDLFHVYDVTTESGNTYTVTKDVYDKGFVGNELIVEKNVIGRNLKSSQYLYKGVPLQEGVLPEYNSYIEAVRLVQQYETDNITDRNIIKPLVKDAYIKLDATKKTLINKLKEESQNGNFKVTQAEYILPNMYKTQFGLVKGMQVSDANEEFFIKQIALKNILQNIKDENKLLEISKFIKSNKSQSLLPIDQIILNLTEALEAVNAVLSPEERQQFEVEKIKELAKQGNPNALNIVLQARNKKASFDKSLELIVGRIPATGKQSISSGKVVGFLEGSENIIITPVELYMIQGADLDIDKAIIQGWNITNNGEFLGNNSVGDNFLITQNKITQGLHDSVNAVENILEANVSVSLDELKEIKKGEETPQNLFNHWSPLLIPKQKNLTAEGKAMTGVEANAQKTESLAAFAYQDNRLNNPLNKYALKPIKGVEFKDELGNVIFELETKSDLSNIDFNGNPTDLKKQSWASYSGLVNAATDNAKEMILGAIKANLQTGNIINTMVMYGYDTKEILGFMKLPGIFDVISLVRYSGNIGSQSRKLSFEDAAKEYTPKNQTEVEAIKKLLEIVAISEEFENTAKILSINRSIPITAEEKYNYVKNFENFINKNFLKYKKEKNEFEVKKSDLFNFKEFITDETYAQNWIDKYQDYMAGFNPLFIIKSTPHIKRNLKSFVIIDRILKSTFSDNEIAENVIQNMKEIYSFDEKTGNLKVTESTKGKDFENSYFTNISKETYKQVLSYINDIRVFGFVKGKQLKLPLSNGLMDITLDNMESINRFLSVFPSIFERIKNNNSSIANNYFFKALDKRSRGNESVLVINNITDMSESEIYDLRFALNNYTGIVNNNLSTGNDTPPIKVGEFIDMLYHYSLLSSKEKISTTSFFELFNDITRARVTNKDGISHAQYMNTFKSQNLTKYAVKSDIKLHEVLTNVIPDAAKLGQVKLYDFDLFEGEYKKVNYTTSKVINSDEVENAGDILKVKFGRGGRTFKIYKKADNGNYYQVANKYQTLGFKHDDNPNSQYYLLDNEDYIAINNSTEIETLLQDGKIQNKGKVNLQVVNGKIDSFGFLPLQSNIGKLELKNGDISLKYQLKNKFGAKNLLNRDVTIQFVKALVGKLKQNFGDINVEYLTTDEINKRFGMTPDTIAFLQGDTIIFNVDEVTIDTPMHEFGHVFMGILKNQNPELYQQAVSLALAENGSIATVVKEKYAGIYKSEEEIGEEIFVTLLGLKSKQEFELNYDTSTNWYKSISGVLNRIGRIFENIISYVVGTNNVYGDKLSSSLYNLLDSTEKSMLNDSFKNIKSQLRSETLLSKKLNLKNISNIKDFLSLFGSYSSKQKSGVENIAKNVVKYANERLTKQEEKSKNKPLFPTEKFVVDSLVDNYLLNHSMPGDRFYTLDDLIKNGIKETNGQRKILNNLKIDEFPDGTGNIVVKVRTIDFYNNKYEFSLYDLGGYNIHKPANFNHGQKNIAGHFVNDTDARRNNVFYDNYRGHVDLLKLTAVGAKLHKENTGITMKDIAVMEYDTYQNSTIQSIGSPFEQGYLTLKAISEMDALKNHVSSSMVTDLKDMFKLDHKKYRTDLKLYYQSMLRKGESYYSSSKFKSDPKREREAKVYRNLLNSINQPKTTEEMIDVLKNRLVHLRTKVKDIEKIAPGTSLDYLKSEMIVINELLYELDNDEKYRLALKENGVNIMQRWIGLPSATGNPIMDYIYKVTNAAMGKIRENTNNFLKNLNPVLEELQKEKLATSPIGSRIERALINNTRLLYEGMLEKTKGYDRQTGETIEVYTGRFNDPKDFTPAQKKFYEFFIKEIEKGQHKLGNTKYKSSNYIPLKLSKGDTALAKSLREGGSLSDTWGNIKEGVQKWWESKDVQPMEYFYQIDETEVPDVFAGQFDELNGMFGNRVRTDSLGLELDNGKVYVVNQSRNQSLESELGQLLQLYAANVYRFEQFAVVNPIIETFRHGVKVQNTLYGLKGDETIDLLDAYKRTNLLNANKKSDSPEINTMNQAVNAASGITSKLLLGFDFFSAATNFSVGKVGVFKDAIFNDIKNKFFSDGEKLFGIAEFAKAEAFVTTQLGKAYVNGEPSIIELLNEQYGISNQDYYNLLQKNNLAYNKGVFTDMFKSENFFWMNHAGDFYNRSVMLVAQMMKDGTLNAYSVKDGKLVYDENLDKRFTTEEGKLLKKALKEQMKKDGQLDSKGNMTRAYDNNTRNTLKYLSDKSFGAYDNENATGLQATALGKMFLMFKRFVPAKIHTYLGGLKNRTYMEANGKYVIKDMPNGTKQYVWEGKFTEGILVSLVEFSKQVKQTRGVLSAWKSLEGYQRQNLVYLFNDVMVLSALILMYESFKDDDDDEENRIIRSLYKGVVDNFEFINPLFYIKLINNPFVTLDFIEDRLQLIEDYFLFTETKSGKQKVTNDKFIEELEETFVVTRSYNNIQEFGSNAYALAMDEELESE